VYENIFLSYTVKQWGQRPEEIDPSVTARVPILISRDDRYFQDAHQGMPLEGYTRLFERILDHPNISLHLNAAARDLLSFEVERGATSEEPFAAALVAGKPYEGLILYSGALDELCDGRFGRLPYRALDFVYRHYDHNPVQPCATINYTVSEDYTRTTEFTWLTGQNSAVSTVMAEYPLSFEGAPGQIPCYPIVGDEPRRLYERYRALFARIPGFYPIGRLGEYRYYDMDNTVLRALELADALL
jgi:UDP-galactopyranose mutase